MCQKEPAQQNLPGLEISRGIQLAFLGQNPPRPERHDTSLPLQGLGEGRIC